MLTCKETSALVSQSLDRRLSFQERWALGLHLFLCEACAQFKRQMEFLRTAARRGAEQIGVRLLHGLSPTARERIRAVLRQDKR